MIVGSGPRCDTKCTVIVDIMGWTLFTACRVLALPVSRSFSYTVSLVNTPKHR